MHKVRTFIGPAMAGNPATVWLNRVPEVDIDSGIHCWVRQLNNRRAAVTCLDANGSIRFCGHGLLAAAAVLLDPAAATPIRELVLSTAEREVVARRRGRRIWLTLPRLYCSPCAIPDFARRCFNSPPMRAALAGDEQGYLLLEWPWSTPFSALDIDAQRLCRHTGRAVIAVQEDRGPNYDYRLRYFAPQYGNTEDAVTGSAHAVAADYWQQRQPGRGRRRALQASAAGGQVFSHVEGDRVSIGGEAEIMGSGGAVRP